MIVLEPSRTFWGRSPSSHWPVASTVLQLWFWVLMLAAFGQVIGRRVLLVRRLAWRRSPIAYYTSGRTCHLSPVTRRGIRILRCGHRSTPRCVRRSEPLTADEQ